MIYELEQLDNLTLTIDCRFPEALAVIEGTNPGWIFVDDLNAPRAALVWAQGIDGFYLVGDASTTASRDELDFHIDQVLKPRLRSLGMAWFEIGGDENWDAAIKNALSERELEITLQRVYTLRLAQETLTRPEVIDDCRLLRVNSQLLVSPTVSNRRFLLSRLIHFWSGVDAFVDTGLGYVLVDNEGIASVCCSGFVTKTNRPQAHAFEGWDKGVLPVWN